MPGDETHHVSDDYAGRAPTYHERLTGRPWDASYRDGPPPWDVGHPHSAVLRLAESSTFAGPVLDAGCGTGANSLEIAARGLEVWGVDVAATAVRQAREAAARRDLRATFLVADGLQLGQLGRRFRTVLDCGLFHTFDDDERDRYVESLADAIEPGGSVYLLCFSDATPGNGGPRHVSRTELESAFGDWRIVDITADRYETRFDAHGAPAWLTHVKRT